MIFSKFGEIFKPLDLIKKFNEEVVNQNKQIVIDKIEKESQFNTLKSEMLKKLNYYFAEVKDKIEQMFNNLADEKKIKREIKDKHMKFIHDSIE